MSVQESSRRLAAREAGGRGDAAGSQRAIAGAGALIAASRPPPPPPPLSRTPPPCRSSPPPPPAAAAAAPAVAEQHRCPGVAHEDMQRSALRGRAPVRRGRIFLSGAGRGSAPSALTRKTISRTATILQGCDSAEPEIHSGEIFLPKIYRLSEIATVGTTTCCQSMKTGRPVWPYG
ncbi:ena/VASP-like protein [Schistocerca serialis cubense]|uniref:ena/VASP-like protein n=1 Tax=Schistocerca serialis cubense TaxID=2023355 RepID=UPI00214E29F8|nr:ena/VASP-like protein [Schistocerca serialis cubense]